MIFVVEIKSFQIFKASLFWALLRSWYEENFGRL